MFSLHEARWHNLPCIFHYDFIFGLRYPGPCAEYLKELGYPKLLDTRHVKLKSRFNASAFLCTTHRRS